MFERYFGLTVFEDKGLYGFVLKPASPKNYLLFILEWGNITLVRLSLDAIYKMTRFSDTPDKSSALLDFFQRDFHIVGDVYISQDDCIQLNSALNKVTAKQTNFLEDEELELIPNEEPEFTPDSEPEFTPDPESEFTPDPEFDVDWHQNRGTFPKAPLFLLILL